MSWDSMEDYQQLVETHPKLKDSQQEQAFKAFLDRMWTKPTTFNELAKAYMEFTTPEKLTFPKLTAMSAAHIEEPSKKQSRRSRKRRSRSRRNRKS